MKLLPILLSSWLLLGLSLPMIAQTPEDILAPHRWQHRLVLVFAPQEDDARIARQLAMIETAAGQERDLLLLLFTPSGGLLPNGDPLSPAQAKAYYARYRIAEEAFTVLLIGKDGGEKMRMEGAIIPQDRLYSLIDAMPMRQHEMRSQKP